MKEQVKLTAYSYIAEYTDCMPICAQLHCYQYLRSLIVTDLYFAYYGSVGSPGCSVTMYVSAVTSTSITVKLMWTNCAGAEPSSSISLMWSPVEDPGNATSRVINTQSIIEGLEPNTTYRITATFSDACGSISDVIVAATPPQLG